MAYFTAPKDLHDLRRFAGYPILLDTEHAFNVALDALDDESGPTIKNNYLVHLRARELQLITAHKLLSVQADGDFQHDPEDMPKRHHEMALLGQQMCEALGVVPGPALRGRLQGPKGSNGTLVL